MFCFEPAHIVLTCNVIFRSALALHCTDDEEEEVVETKAHKRHRKLEFSGEGLSELLLCLFYVQPFSLRSILILPLNLSLLVSPLT
jgi:hypothetical protein